MATLPTETKTPTASPSAVATDATGPSFRTATKDSPAVAFFGLHAREALQLEVLDEAHIQADAHFNEVKASGWSIDALQGVYFRSLYMSAYASKYVHCILEAAAGSTDVDSDKTRAKMAAQTYAAESVNGLRYVRSSALSEFKGDKVNYGRIDIAYNRVLCSIMALLCLQAQGPECVADMGSHVNVAHIAALFCRCIEELEVQMLQLGCHSDNRTAYDHAIYRAACFIADPVKCLGEYETISALLAGVVAHSLAEIAAGVPTTLALGEQPTAPVGSPPLS